MKKLLRFILISSKLTLLANTDCTCIFQIDNSSIAKLQNQLEDITHTNAQLEHELQSSELIYRQQVRFSIDEHLNCWRVCRS